MANNVVSTFFFNEQQQKEQDYAERLLHLVDELNLNLEQIQLPSEIKYVYNATIYARNTFEKYIWKYCNTSKPIMYFGMNAGPWGMSQTGVPFGEINAVRDWLKIEGSVSKPPKENKNRPVKGFECPRTEVSGKRFWGLFKNVCGTPEIFFKTSFVFNYLPQQWMKENGCNLTPGDFKVSEMEPIFSICDPAFVKILKLYEVHTVVAIGKFCETRAQKAIKKYYPSSSVKVLYMPHPSPRTVNNTNWEQKAVGYLKDLKLLENYQNSATNVT